MLASVPHSPGEPADDWYGQALFGRPVSTRLGGVEVRIDVHRRPVLAGIAALAALAAATLFNPGGPSPATGASARAVAGSPTVLVATPATKIEHLVVLFGENISYDHYFGTYPR